ncbi:VWA domain-containing protein [Natrarchaeobius oligotrophus]|uniref:VWA domain-containing protein n=1 Tax=Natrarchaeobius chitinivorans TaxID=1679083 RepID=A0A3N6MH89_NATCH|nr:VWA domain-containing protein [Natrarchaeobius chitinivorans]RQH03494.1 VWA domain-containing protein [Natrarchaeobius chitinivorans]
MVSPHDADSGDSAETTARGSTDSDRSSAGGGDDPRTATAASNRFGDAATGSDHGVPDFVAARRHVLTELLWLATVLRRNGVSVPTTGPLEAARTLSVVGLSEQSRVDAALRATLVTEAADRDAFDDAFPQFWHRLRTGLERIATAHGRDRTTGTDDADGDPADAGSGREEEPQLLPEAETPSTVDGQDGPGPAPQVRIATDRRRATGDRPDAEESSARRYSPVGGSRLVDAELDRLSSGERASIHRFVDALATIPGRRRRPASSGAAVDARRALRASLATGGAPLELPAREPTPTELRCCVLVDVSGSVLDTIDRSVLLHFAEHVQRRARYARVFLFDTDLVDATAEFERSGGNPAAALRDARVEWGGGTKIGAALETLRRRHPDAVDRRTVVVVVSDGLDVGEPELLEDGITWLADRADSIVWLNPLATSPAFEPSSRGMAASVPYVDALFGFVGPEDLAAAARQIERRGLDGPVGYEYDRRRRERTGATADD